MWSFAPYDLVRGLRAFLRWLRAALLPRRQDRAALASPPAPPLAPPPVEAALREVYDALSRAHALHEAQIGWLTGLTLNHARKLKGLLPPPLRVRAKAVGEPPGEEEPGAGSGPLVPGPPGPLTSLPTGAAGIDLGKLSGRKRERQVNH